MEYPFQLLAAFPSSLLQPAENLVCFSLDKLVLVARDLRNGLFNFAFDDVPVPFPFYCIHIDVSVLTLSHLSSRLETSSPLIRLELVLCQIATPLAMRIIHSTDPKMAVQCAQGGTIRRAFTS